MYNLNVEIRGKNYSKPTRPIRWDFALVIDHSHIVYISCRRINRTSFGEKSCLLMIWKYYPDDISLIRLPRGICQWEKKNYLLTRYSLSMTVKYIRMVRVVRSSCRAILPRYSWVIWANKKSHTKQLFFHISLGVCFFVTLCHVHWNGNYRLKYNSLTTHIHINIRYGFFFFENCFLLESQRAIFYQRVREYAKCQNTCTFR